MAKKLAKKQCRKLSVEIQEEEDTFEDEYGIVKSSYTGE